MTKTGLGNVLAGLVMLVLILITPLASCGGDLDREAGMEEGIEALLSKIYQSGEPGAALLVKKGDRILVRRGFGMADLELGVALDPDMVFRIGSITKQFTAVGILMLAEEGKLDLQDEITKFLSDYPTQGKTITIEHLLTHTSGIKSYTSMPDFFAMMRKDMSVDEVIDVFKGQPMEFGPGESWNYNNSGYILLGAVIEKVSGVSYAEFVQKNIFDPAGMKHSFYGGASPIIPGRAEGYSSGRKGFVNAPYLSMTLPYAAGSLLSSVDDLALWFQSLLEGKLIAEESLKKAWESYSLIDGTDTGYGYGWMISEYEGFRIIEHGGGINGFTSHLIFVPAEKLVVVLLTNSDIGARAPGTPAFKVAAMALGKPCGDPKSVSIEPAGLDSLTGVYATKTGLKRFITREGNTLFSQRAGGERQEIFPLSNRKFFFRDSFTRLTFMGDSEGLITEVRAQGRTGMAEVYVKTDEPLPIKKREVAMDPSLLKNYVGEYEVGPGFTVMVTLEEGRLMIEPTGQSKDPIFPESESLFFLKNVDAQVEFVEDDSGKVTGLIIHQGGQKIPAKKK